MQRLPADSGIVIGPLLFVIALLAIIGVVLAVGTSGFGTAGVSDRVYNDVYSQANLIRTKINECNIKYGTNNNNDGYPPSSDMTDGVPVCSLVCDGDPSTSESGTDCAGNGMTMQNLWFGIRPTVLPPPTTGTNQWYYINAGATGGRCIWTSPSAASTGMTAGLTMAANKFSSQEVVFNAGGATQRFVILITYPTGTVDAHCTSP